MNFELRLDILQSGGLYILACRFTSLGSLFWLFFFFFYFGWVGVVITVQLASERWSLPQSWHMWFKWSRCGGLYSMPLIYTHNRENCNYWQTGALTEVCICGDDGVGGDDGEWNWSLRFTPLLPVTFDPWWSSTELGGSCDSHCSTWGMNKNQSGAVFISIYLYRNCEAQCQHRLTLYLDRGIIYFFGEWSLP